MTAFQHMLFATDFSEPSQRALKQAATAAQGMKARITLLNIISPTAQVVGTVEPDAVVLTAGSAAVPTLGMEPEAAAEWASKRLEELRNQVSSDIEVAVDTVIDMDTAAAIVNYGKEHGVSLIAMATHARSGISRLVLGSVAESVVRQSCIPTMLFPPAETDTQ